MLDSKSTVCSFVILTILLSPVLALSGEADPTPKPWPDQFHAVLVMNITTTAKMEVIDLWYDWPNGRNFNIIQKQLGSLVYDLEWNNGTSFVYTLDENRECRTLKFEVGILRPDWLDGATYLGRRSVDGFDCDVWEKAEFITYYEDVVTRRPVHWAFYTGRSAHVMTFEVGAVLGDRNWQAPSYCFDRSSNGGNQGCPAYLGTSIGLSNILNRGRTVGELNLLLVIKVG